MEKTNGSFELTKDGITLYVNWDKKNYQVSSTIDGIQFSEYSHMMFMCPRFFTEEDVRKKCVELIPDFLFAYRIISENKDYFSEKETSLMQMKSKMHEEIQTLNEKRRELKQQLKNGTLPKKEYDKQYSEIKYKKSESVQTISDFITCTAKEITVSNTRCCSIINNYLNDILKK